jgi:hypothetical protein
MALNVKTKRINEKQELEEEMDCLEFDPLPVGNP